MSLSDILARGQANGLASLKLPELRQIAAAQGLKGTSGLRKGDLIAAIESAGTGGGGGAAPKSRPEKAPASQEAPVAGAREGRPEESDRERGNDRADNERGDNNRGDSNLSLIHI